MLYWLGKADMRKEGEKMLEKKTATEINIIMKKAVDKIRALLKEDVYKIVLYGSYARGDFNTESDIDMMVILNCEKEKVAEYRKQVSKLASRIGLEYDIELSILLRDKNTFEQGKIMMPFYKNIQQEGIALYG